MADSDMPVVGKMYHACFELQEYISKLAMDDDDRTEVLTAFGQRWNMLHTDLHAFGYVTDPEFQDHDSHTNAEVRC